MIRNLLAFLTVLLILGFVTRKTIAFCVHFLPYYLAGPSPSSECGQGPGFRYCVYKPPRAVQEDPDAVLYFLHWGSGSEKTWKKVPISRVFYAEFRRRNLKAPKVVSLSFGWYWTLFDRPGGRLHSPTAKDFLDLAMPWLEAKAKVPKRRYLWGMSQGGLNAALLLFKRPKLWSGAVLECPAIYALDVYATKEKKEAYAAQRNLELDRLQYGMDLVLNRIRSPEEWRREDPMARAAKAPSSLPPIFIDGNESDDMGFFDGAQKFAKLLRKRGETVEFMEEPGSHCAVDPVAPSRFLADLEERSRLPSSSTLLNSKRQL